MIVNSDRGCGVSEQCLACKRARASVRTVHVAATDNAGVTDELLTGIQRQAPKLFMGNCGKGRGHYRADLFWIHQTYASRTTAYSKPPRQLNNCREACGHCWRQVCNRHECNGIKASHRQQPNPINGAGDLFAKPLPSMAKNRFYQVGVAHLRVIN